ncbi:helix-turn-helix transcriptional regulator [Janthinobacterium rivuli]|uniref:helix-turn-helix transcriptional regulator n=1 Tax=Janthinobacterium sp. FT68W TaxID=2654255 RepID=UPI001D02C927|nr:AlpA family phage regulatory protein [Janthinobacterium sp. FT68W]
MQLNPKQIKQERQPTKPQLLSATNGRAMEVPAKPLAPVYMTLIQQMHDTKDHSVLRLPASAKKMGRANSTYWQDVKNGTVPPAIRLGKRSVGWLLAELDAILAARALASRTNTPLDIKLFVSILAGPRLSLKKCNETTEGVENV